MIRRTFLKSIAASLASFILPAPRRQIDLMQFCGGETSKYDFRLPYEVDGHTYATDARVCVQVAPATADKVQHTGPVPPFGGLSWNHDRLRGWRELPKLEAMPAADSYCPQCDGVGHLPSGVVSKDCEKCDGMGTVWVGGGWSESFPRTCRVCAGKGYLMPPGCVVCSRCNGNAIGVFNSVVVLDGRHFDVRHYEKARSLGCEYLHDNWNAIVSWPMMRFQFDGGLGLLMGLDPLSAEKRLRDAVS